jgi:hypothetical protein
VASAEQAALPAHSALAVRSASAGFLQSTLLDGCVLPTDDLRGGIRDGRSALLHQIRRGVLEQPQLLQRRVDSAAWMQRSLLRS